jgi:hypothetical protein
VPGFYPSIAIVTRTRRNSRGQIGAEAAEIAIDAGYQCAQVRKLVLAIRKFVDGEFHWGVLVGG